MYLGPFKRYRFSRSMSRRVVQLVLVTWFLAQCVISLIKLLQRDIGTAESSDHEGNPVYPSVTACAILAPTEAHESLEEAYEALDPMASRLVYLEQNDFTDSEDVYVNGSNIEDYAKKGIISETMTAYNERLLKCFTYNPPGRSSLGIPGQIDIMLWVKGTFAWGIFVHNRDMFSPSMTKPYGSTYTIISSDSASQHAEETFEIDRTKWTLENTAKTPCGSAPSSIVDCIHHNIEEQLGCKLPWTKDAAGVKPNAKCDHGKVVKELQDVIKMGENPVAKEMGCLGSCERFSYDIRRVLYSRKDVAPGEEVILKVSLAITGGSFGVKKQYVIYDLSSLISDIGGYLGLLLGQSLLTSYDMVLNWITNRK